MGILLGGDSVVAGAVLPAVLLEDGFGGVFEGGAGEAGGVVVAVVPTAGGKAGAFLGPASDGAFGGVAYGGECAEGFNDEFEHDFPNDILFKPHRLQLDQEPRAKD